jgi:radical SAM superfamily enzyme YgiQ (UPF0313 family)
VNNRVLLLNFYGYKSLGLRCLEQALEDAGFEVRVVYLKRFHSTRPQRPTPAELALLTGLARDFAPLFIGCSVISSLYLDVVREVSLALKPAASVFWGGVYPTLFPERCLPYAHYAVRGEGEDAIADIARCLQGGGDPGLLPNVGANPLRPLRRDLDALLPAPVGKGNKYFIENGKLTRGDPQARSLVYETSCSRGCPFRCSYCSAAAQKRVFNDKHYLRVRSPGSVVAELESAKARMKRLRAVHFWDEIFPHDPDWTREFAAAYKAKINLPFEVWLHPLRMSAEQIALLRGAGLYQAVMGIQSGCEAIRRKVFRRPESDEQILSAARILNSAGIPKVVYDFILRHPFESPEQLRETHELVKQLPRPYTLQLHDLNWLPGADITQMAVDAGFHTSEEMDAMLAAPMEEQYARWWQKPDVSPERDRVYKLIYIEQFPALARKAPSKAEKTYKKARKLARRRHYAQKIKELLIGRLRTEN